MTGTSSWHAVCARPRPSRHRCGARTVKVPLEVHAACGLCAVAGADVLLVSFYFLRRRTAGNSPTELTRQSSAPTLRISIGLARNVSISLGAAAPRSSGVNSPILRQTARRPASGRGWKIFAFAFNPVFCRCLCFRSYLGLCLWLRSGCRPRLRLRSPLSVVILRHGLGPGLVVTKIGLVIRRLWMRDGRVQRGGLFRADAAGQLGWRVRPVGRAQPDVVEPMGAPQVDRAHQLVRKRTGRAAV